MNSAAFFQWVEQQPIWLLPVITLLFGALLTALVAAWRYRHQKATAIAELQSHWQLLQEHESALTEQRERDWLDRLRQADKQLLELRENRDRMSEQLSAARAQSARQSAQLERLAPLEKALEVKDDKLSDSLRELGLRQARIAELESQISAERTAAQEKLALLENAREQLGNQFKALANQILEEKSARFSAQNQEQLGHLLNPLREQIGDFRKKVEDVYDRETRDRMDLKGQIEQLRGLNERISKDAINLTQALKGEAKTQGNWGEVVLERVLESSGLRLGHEYRREVVAEGAGGSRLRPDVIIDLPENRHIVVDSKVSLSAYERAASAEDKAAQSKALAEHVQSLRTHIRQLSGKDYPTLHGLHSLDFVLLFIPIEGAFHAALAEAPQLYSEAYRHNIVLVSPTTLLATCRTIENIWRIEQQNRNAEKIARQAAQMLDKFSGFVADLEKVGEQLDRAQAAYRGARNKLDEGRGNLLSRARQLSELGVKAKKPLPEGKDDAALGAADSE